MSNKVVSQSLELREGVSITVETGKLARLAHGAVTVQQGNCILLATVVSNNELREGIDFFPLSIDYQEKFASAGRIPGGFRKREGRLTDQEVLVCRLVDRALRPLFPDDYKFETQVMISLISSDKEVMPDSLAAFAASAAIALSDIPFNGPISEVRVARVENQWIVNPKRSELENADFEIIVAASNDNVVMVEGEMQECSEEDLIQGIQVGHEAIKKQCALQLELAKMAGVPEEKRDYDRVEIDQELYHKVESLVKDKVYEIASSGLSKSERKEGLSAIKEQLIESLTEEVEEEKLPLLKTYYSSVEKKVIRKMILEDHKRLDGRELNEVRPLEIEVDLLPSTHGSALFTRGETQALATTTLGTKLDEKLLDMVTGVEFRRYMLHYNFPPYCTGEAKPVRGTSRREIGHGNLAWRSLKQVLPPDEENPYTIRVVSDVLMSNGSSSMASVCAGSLSLMDAGVPVKGGVSGIAMGMISDEDGNVAILSDILGDEDHLGDMDFKVTGTSNGICACQMDIKIDGLPYETLAKALEQAKEGRLHILNAMNEVLSESRPDLKPHTPRVETIYIEKEFIGAIIGPGGKNIQELQKETDTVINIEEIDDKGKVTIATSNGESLKAAIDKINAITYVPEVGDIFESTVKSIMPYGAFVEFLPGKQGLLHISEIMWKRLENLDGILNEGDKVKVKIIGIDKRSGKFKLSRKVLMPRPERNSQ